MSLRRQVEAFVAPSEETSAAVQSWLSANSLIATPISPAGDWLTFNITVEQANALLNADFTTFTNEATGKDTIRTLSYSVPASLKEQISFVHPTVA